MYSALCWPLTKMLTVYDVMTTAATRTTGGRLWFVVMVMVMMLLVLVMRRSYHQRAAIPRAVNRRVAIATNKSTRFRWLILIATARLRTVGHSLMVVLRYHIVGEVVRAARPEHERVHADAHMLALGFDAFPHEHTGAFDSVHRAGLRRDLKVLTSAARCGACYPVYEDQ